MVSEIHVSSGLPTHPGGLVGEEVLGWLHGAQDQAFKDAQAGRYAWHPAGKTAFVGTWPAHETDPWASVRMHFSRGEKVLAAATLSFLLPLPQSTPML